MSGNKKVGDFFLDEGKEQLRNLNQADTATAWITFTNGGGATSPRRLLEVKYENAGVAELAGLQPDDPSCGGVFNLILYEEKSGFDDLVQWNKSRLHDWANKGGLPLNFLDRVLRNLPTILEEWEKIESDREIVARSVLEFLDSRQDVRNRQHSGVHLRLVEYYYISAPKPKKGATGEALETDAARWFLDAAQRWLTVCADDGNQAWFDDEEKPIREVAVKAVADDLMGFRRSDRPSVEDVGKKADFLLERARSWLLSRYDIGTAAQISFRSKLGQSAFQVIPETVAATILCAVVLLLPSISGRISHEGLELDGILVAISSAVRAVLFLLYLAPFLPIVLYWRRRNTRAGIQLGNSLQVFLPRLMAGIAVGYFVLLSDEAWGGIMAKGLRLLSSGEDVDVCVFVARFALPLVAVLAYVLVETSHVQGIRIGMKPFRIFLRGYSYAVLLGLAFSDLLGRASVARVVTDAEVLDAKIVILGLVGNIYPEVIFFQAPMALFIGVFLQLLWEDKALTEKI